MSENSESAQAAPASSDALTSQDSQDASPATASPPTNTSTPKPQGQRQGLIIVNTGHAARGL